MLKRNSTACALILIYYICNIHKQNLKKTKMSYNTYLSTKDAELDSPSYFTKSPSKVGYGSSSKNDDIQMLKQKYGLGKNSKKNTYGNFEEVKKVSDDLSSLRQTINSTSYNKFHKSSIEQTNPKDSFKRSQVGKPQINLRQTLYQKKVETQDVPSFIYQHNPHYETRDKKEPQTNKYSIKVNEPKETHYQKQKGKIDYDKINEKLKNNAMMIEELRKLKEQRKNRKQQKQSSKFLGTNQSQMKLVSSKSTQISINTPKYSSTNPENIFKKTENNKYDTSANLKPKYQYTTTQKPKYQHLDLQKSKYQLQKSKYQSPKVDKKYQSNATTNSNNEKPKSNYSTPQKAKENIIGVVKQFILIKNLGQGKFGTVFLSFHKTTGAIFALKKVPKEMIKQHFLIDQFILQLKLQSYFNHGKILTIFGFFDDKQSIYLVLQYMEEGTLFSYLKKNKTLSQKDAAKKIKDVAQAVYSLHEQGVAHRDIKPENIVMSYGVCKLCDFGWATICNQRRKTYCGTFDYAAPQILQGAQYDMSVDTWCLGILAYQLMVGKAPFYHISRKQTMKKIMNVDNNSVNYPQTMSKLAVSFIENLIIKNPEQRMKSDEILKHKFLDIKEQANILL